MSPTNPDRDQLAARRSRHRDEDAADLLRKLMVSEGLSPERLSPLIKAKGVQAGYAPSRVRVSPDTLRLILTGHEPGPRVKFAVALYFGLKPGDIWERDKFELPVLRAAA